MNSYPTVRGFTAIGTGGDDFVHSMVIAVESVLQQPIPEVNLTNQHQSFSCSGAVIVVCIMHDVCYLAECSVDQLSLYA